MNHSLRNSCSSAGEHDEQRMGKGYLNISDLKAKPMEPLIKILPLLSALSAVMSVPQSTVLRWATARSFFS